MRDSCYIYIRAGHKLSTILSLEQAHPLHRSVSIVTYLVVLEERFLCYIYYSRHIPNIDEYLGVLEERFSVIYIIAGTSLTKFGKYSCLLGGP